MEWTDEGFVVGVRRHGENNAVVELLTRDHGRHLGLVRGGAGTRLRPVLQPGNRVRATWRARLSEHLGHYTIEPEDMAASRWLAAPHALYGLGTVCALVRLLPERDPHPPLYEALGVVLEHLAEPAAAGPLVVRFEMAILAELGFGLDLASCAATGAAGDLAYVSPKSGRAVSRDAGAPWHDRLLALPAFLAAPEATIAPRDVAAGFRLTGHFLARDVFEPRGLPMPEARAAFIAAVTAAG